MSRIFWIVVLFCAAFMIQSVFVGGDYVRFAGERLGINSEKLDKVADFADSFRLDEWMAEKSAATRNADKRRLGN